MTKLNSEPDLAFFGQMIKRETLLAMNCHAIGTIQEFDESDQSARVSLNYRKALNGRLVDYPVLAGCPVITPNGGGGFLTFPITVGDTCLVFFNDVDMDAFIAGGQVAEPGTTRSHSFSDALVFVGPKAFPQAFSDYDTTNVILQSPAKLGFKNPTKDLRTELEKLTLLLDTFFTATSAAAIEPTLGPAAAAAKAALAVYKTSLQGLLK